MATPQDSAGASERRSRITALFQGARRGDRRQLDQLVTELSPLLWQVARAQGLDRVASEDVVQLTWMSLLREMDKIREPAAVVGWLVKTTKREAWRVRSRQRLEMPAGDVLVDGPDEGEPGPVDRALISDRRRRLWAAVEQLSQRCRELLRVVAFVPRPDYTALAEVLGMATGGVGPTRKRCLAKLKSLLDAEPEGGWS